MFYFIIEFPIGMLFCTLGYLVWIKKRIDFIYYYHIKSVKDIDEYCNCMGRCVFFIGIAFLLLSTFGYLGVLELIITQVFIGLSLLIGLTILLVSHKKLTGHIF